MSEPEAILRPVDARRSKRGLLVGSAAVLAVAGVTAGAFLIAGGSDAPTDTVELATDTPDAGIEAPASFSFAAATANAETSASVTYDMSMQTPDGPLTMDVTVDRASSLASMTVDMSQLTQEMGMEFGDSIRMIIDESAQHGYLSSELFTSLFGETDAEWILMDLDAPDMDAGGLDELFSNPLDMTELFGDLEPVDLGVETVEGEELRHFQVSLDAETLSLIELGGVIGDVLAPGATQTIDIWVSEGNQVRRMTFDALDDGATLSIDMWIEMSTAPADIPLPDPADVVDMNELFGTMFEDIEIDLGDLEFEE
jgi:hypothetical protein